MRNRILLIIIILLVLIVAATGAYFLTRGKTETQPAQELVQPEVKSKISLLISEPVISPILSFGGASLWFVTAEGRMLRQNWESGEQEEYLLPEALENPVKIIWQQQGSNFIVEQNLGGHTRYKFFNADTRNSTEYPDQLRDPAFLPDESKISYIWVRGDGGYELKVSDADGSNFRKVADLFRPDYKLVASRARDEVALFARDPAAPGQLFLVDLASGEFGELDSQALYEGAKFSPDGLRLLAVKNGSLVIYDLEGGGSLDLGITRQLNQVLWTGDGQGLILASPTGISRIRLADLGQEDLYEFAAEELFEPIELLTHPSKPLLFFVDELTGYLYRLEL